MLERVADSFLGNPKDRELDVRGRPQESLKPSCVLEVGNNLNAGSGTLLRQEGERGGEPKVVKNRWAQIRGDGAQLVGDDPEVIAFRLSVGAQLESADDPGQVL